MDFLVANKQAQIERMGEGENRERAKWERKKRGSEDKVEERKARVEREERGDDRWLKGNERGGEREWESGERGEREGIRLRLFAFLSNEKSFNLVDEKTWLCLLFSPLK
jgi:hypothetical protein